MNNNTIHLLDETSAMHLQHEQYFIIIIGGYLIDNINYIRSKCQKIEKNLRINNKYISELKEIKGVKLKNEHLVNYISYIYKNSKSFIPVSILIDKTKLNKKKWNENEAFNFFVKYLLNYLIKFNIIEKKYNNLVINMDNRTISTKFKNSLETHLNLNFYNYNINFSVEIKDSKIYPEIRGADIICYAVYRIYNHYNSIKTNELWKFLNMKNIKLLTYQSFFPYSLLINNEFIKKIKSLELLKQSDNIIL